MGYINNVYISIFVLTYYILEIFSLHTPLNCFTTVRTLYMSIDIRTSTVITNSFIVNLNFEVSNYRSTLIMCDCLFFFFIYSDYPSRYLVHCGLWTLCSLKKSNLPLSTNPLPHCSKVIKWDNLSSHI